MNINYAPFHEPLSKADVDAYTLHFKKPIPIGAIVFASILALVVIVGLLVNIFTHGNYASTIPFIVFSGVIVAIVILSARAQKRRRARLFKFARTNGIELIIDNTHPSYNGMIFDEGHSRVVREAFILSNGAHIGSYKYTTGSGKRRTDHYWGFARVTLPRQLPHMVLDAKKNNFMKRFTNLPDGFDKNQILHLEGDFNDYFTLYAPKQYERDALYVFTPDVMAAVIDAGAEYDMEVIGDTLMVYMPYGLKLDDETRLKNIFRVIESVGSELKDQTDYYADARVGDRAMNMVAAPGRRLKSRVKWSTILIFVAFFVCMVYTILKMHFK